MKEKMRQNKHEEVLHVVHDDIMGTVGSYENHWKVRATVVPAKLREKSASQW